MNILVLSWRDHKHPQAGGAEQVMREHMKGWIAGGHDITLFSSRFIGCRTYEKSEGMEIFHSGDQYIGVKIDAFKFWLKNNRKFDLVVDQFHGIPFFTPFYVKKPKLAVLQEVAKEVWFLNGFPPPLNYIVGLIGFLAEPFIFPFYKRIPFMVGSESAKNDLAKMGISKNNITIVPHGVIVKRPKIMPKKETTNTIVFLGALTKDKGIEDAINAFSLLDRKGTFNFWIIGKDTGNYGKKLFNMSEKLITNNKVTFWGRVNDDKKFELLAKAHILVNPSIREGWGLVNIEANAMGTPVIAYKSAGLIDSVEENVSGVICRRNTAGELAKEILALVRDKKKYTKLSKGALFWSKKFSWRNSKDKSLKLINGISNL